ncbi:dienelactone hydrolase family protein [candidate division KSB1 bacterium]|nr:dienelactone hydrolase family protein [candidate division KSB1 bacterium]NIR68881.1 dienelactone hydrolase family protein [candidate division KSB1 bacterium]NIS27249.1 dienelactone hydrolase family protein [candidate division KSB1 bacterium]NIT74134.1 dienelactone hydrolase family protein [candidate division KSB1 bacterium]NIU27983.1 dienelactone hydrolase family protein [candidate division KSB1 bacterium]
MRKACLVLLTVLLSTTITFAQDWAREDLEKSPRHQEWVTIKHDNRVVHAFVVYPEVENKVPAILVIHENRGLTDWVRSLADQVAAAGYIAVAPDLLSGMGPDGGKTSDFPSSDAAREGIYKLSTDQVTADLNTAFDYATALSACNGKVAAAGFCWGGSQTFRFATNQADLEAAFVFYGRSPGKDAISRIECPVYGFYGGRDSRVNSTIPQTEEHMQESGKTFEPMIYEGAGHGFMRSGEAPDASEANKEARQEAWKRWMDLLKEM